MSDDLAVDVRGLRKSYGDQLVLDGVDLAVRAGTVTALLGPNGAGKTTTIGILSTLLRPDGGTARVAGHDVVADPQAVRGAIGVTGQLSAVDDLLTGRAAGRERTDALLARFGLTDAARKPVSTWSGGMRRKLDLAMTLVGSPAVVFLDEPTTGLDPRSRRTLWDEVRALVAAGTTILLTTQYLDEADHLADRVAVLDGGRVVAEGTPAELKSTHDAGTLDDVFLRLTAPSAAADPSSEEVA
jgi:ABC-2 type transport system ATP-binding protein